MPGESLLELAFRELLPVAKDGLLTLIATHQSASTRSLLRERSVMGEAPPVEAGCPYCACVKLLATSHRYLLRGAVKHQMAGTYQQLVQYSIKEVLLILENGRHSAPRHLSLLQQATDMDILLSIPLSQPEMREAAQRCYHMTDLALDLAEWHNGGETTPQPFALPASDVIEVEGRVVS